MTRFYLGCHQPSWLERADFALFISHRRLVKRLGPRARRPLPVARRPWGLDSAAFTELALHGRWTITPADYVAAVRRYREEIGHLATVSCQDWMCEEIVRAGGRIGNVRFAGTGMSIRAHQRKTVDNALELFHRDVSIPWMPVLQGWSIDDYHRCADLYESRGIDLRALPVVGLGSVCRRSSTGQIVGIVEAMAARGYRLHGFGIKSKGLDSIGHLLAAADSLAWSYRGRRVAGCTPTHRSESNCYSFAERWRADLLARPRTGNLVRGGA